ncbi:transporter substrate-binding domain-containing protein [Allopusillimonas ginsengisoli]|nr:transporter substrate-binding domain-containing protein [Allopusillimonas ginsengisoli]
MLLAVVCVAAAPASAGAASVAHSDEHAMAERSLVLGVHYVIPPFIGGSKVRTPDAPDMELAEALAHKLNRSVVATPARDPESAVAGLRRGDIDAALISVPAKATVPNGEVATVPTGYVSRPMAIMRTDTDITTWDQLKGRTVCLSQGGLYVGSMAARYGALEKVMRAPADSLLAMRVGECDAAVHDEALLKALLKFPEWKKFSASLPPGPQAKLVFAVSAQDVDTLDAARKLVAEWRRQRHLAEITAKRAQDIAFEVYLDQEVPDCH